MSFKPLRITAHLDGSGLYYDPCEPIMLDGVLAAANCRHHVHGEPPARDETPDEIPLPLGKWRMGGAWGWRASAFFPEGETAESTIFWRKRLRQNRIELAHGSPNLTSGTYRDWNMPLPLLLTRRLTAFAFGDRRNVLAALKDIRWIGRKRAHGRGRVIDMTVEVIDDDYSLCRDGAATRWLPCPNGARMVRPRPPYWNIVGRIKCCEIGADRSLSDDAGRAPPGA